MIFCGFPVLFSELCKKFTTISPEFRVAGLAGLRAIRLGARLPTAVAGAIEQMRFFLDLY